MTRAASRQARDIGAAMLFLLPSLLLFVVFVFYPLGKTIYLSLFFTSPQGNPRVFAGLDQYLELLTSPVFHAGLV
ncbi:MAG: sugar ABC transporter permease, partial [Chloroflexota bacterium]|nr:sugar ABC transporter permease [Chloroflexota bacterium]